MALPHKAKSGVGRLYTSGPSDIDYFSHADSDKVATFDMKLMDIDAEHLAIPVSIKAYALIFPIPLSLHTGYCSQCGSKHVIFRVSAHCS